jgi:hypothetical protein
MQDRNGSIVKVGDNVRYFPTTSDDVSYVGAIVKITHHWNAQKNVYECTAHVSVSDNDTYGWASKNIELVK